MKWRSQARLVLRWARVNAVFLLAAFLIVGLLSRFFPLPMLTVFGRWATLLHSFGARTADELSSTSQMFAHILQRNAIAALVYFALGLLLQAPLVMLLGGAFYAFVAFLAPYTIGRSFGVLDWLLIAVENLALVMSASLSSGLAGELNQVAPSVGDWWRYSKSSWRSLSMRTAVDWKDVLPSWTWTLLIGALVVAGLLLFVAWFEVYGY